MTQTQTITQIAHQKLGIKTLSERQNDSLDFYDLSVGSIERALNAAYEAGIKAASGCTGCISMSRATTTLEALGEFTA